MLAAIDVAQRQSADVVIAAQSRPPNLTGSETRSWPPERPFGHPVAPPADRNPGFGPRFRDPLGCLLARPSENKPAHAKRQRFSGGRSPPSKGPVKPLNLLGPKNWLTGC